MLVALARIIRSVEDRKPAELLHSKPAWNLQAQLVAGFRFPTSRNSRRTGAAGVRGSLPRSSDTPSPWELQNKARATHWERVLQILTCPARQKADGAVRIRSQRRCRDQRHECAGSFAGCRCKTGRRNSPSDAVLFLHFVILAFGWDAPRLQEGEPRVVVVEHGDETVIAALGTQDFEGTAVCSADSTVITYRSDLLVEQQHRLGPRRRSGQRLVRSGASDLRCARLSRSAISSNAASSTCP